MINYDLKASAADVVKVEIRLSRLSLPFIAFCHKRGVVFVFIISFLLAAFCLYLHLPFFIFLLSFLFSLSVT
jgi:hypothetical protein